MNCLLQFDTTFFILDSHSCLDIVTITYRCEHEHLEIEYRTLAIYNRSLGYNRSCLVTAQYQRNTAKHQRKADMWKNEKIIENAAIDGERTVNEIGKIYQENWKKNNNRGYF